MNLPSSDPSRRLVLCAAGAALAAPWSATLAQPQGMAGARPVTLVVSYPAGGGADLMARILAPRLGAALGRSVVVENIPGASGQIAGERVARATPDGATLLLDASSFAVNPSLYPRMAYDSAKAFTPLAVLATFPNVLVCSAGFRVRSVQDLIAMARDKPASVAYASSGNGSAQHLAGALFEERASVQLLHIPYRGGGPAMNDVMAGKVPLFFANVASALGYIRAGKLRALAVTSSLRARSLPQVPTMAEVGVRKYEVLEWNPVLAPAGLPADVQARLVTGIRQALADPEVLSRIRKLGGDVFPGATPAAAEKFIQDQRSLWAEVVRDRKISVG